MTRDPRAAALRDLTRSTGQLDKAQRRHRDLIVAARALGVPVREVAAAAGVSPQTVLNVVASETASPST